MKRLWIVMTVVGGLALSGSAQAQPPGYRPPNSSPVYGLLGQNTAAGRYINGLRTQQNTQAGFQNLQQQVDTYGRMAPTPGEGDLTAEGIRATGHGATFMNFGHYYPTRAGGGAPRAAGPAPYRR